MGEQNQGNKINNMDFCIYQGAQAKVFFPIETRANANFNAVNKARPIQKINCLDLCIGKTQ